MKVNQPASAKIRLVKRSGTKTGTFLLAQGKTEPFTIKRFCVRYGMQQYLLPRLSGFSQRAIDSWAAGKKPSGPAVKRLTELERLFAALSKLVDAKSIGAWLSNPNPAFDGSTPLQVIERGESDRLWRMIYQLESGQPG